MKKKLKVDLHTHTAEDPLENIKYDSFQLIDKASQEGFDVLAISTPIFPFSMPWSSLISIIVILTLTLKL